MDTKAFIEERVKLHEESKALLDRAMAEKRTLSKEEQETFDKMHLRMAELKETLDREYASQQIERSLAESRGRQTDSRIVPVEVIDPKWDVEQAFRAWALGGRRSKHVSQEMLAACERMVFDPEIIELETRALNNITATQGQALIPDEMMRAYWEALKWFGPMRTVSTTLNTSTGAPLPIPNADDTSNVGEIIDTGAAVTTTADPTFAQTLLGAFKYSSKAVIVPVELLQDSFINLPTYLGSKLGERIGRIQNTHFTTGAGTTLPFGLQVQATLGKTATATNAITWDEVIDLEHSVDKAYRSKPGVGFMVHDTTAATLRKLKDSQNRYLWEISVQLGQPDRAMGYPVYINNDMDSALTTNKRLVLFGDYSTYYIRDAGGVTILRSDEVRILNHQSVFLAFQRSDGNLLNTAAVKYLRTA
jgi:HK97 family phage major capsid protein